MDIDDRINKLQAKSTDLKIQLNSYYMNNASKGLLDKLMDERKGVKEEIRNLNLLKIRKEKILKIKNRNNGII